MKKQLSAAWAVGILCLALLTPAGAMAKQARFPEQRGAVTDDANVLSETVTGDIVSFQTLASSRTGVQVRVAIVHFLDGMDVQTYADALFSRWSLGDDDFLLLGAVGEDCFASVSGGDVKRHFSDSNAQSLLYTSQFSELFKAQRYDEAFSMYFIAFADMLGKQFGESVPLGTLFAPYRQGVPAMASPSLADTVTEAVTQAISHGSNAWQGVMDSVTSNVQQYDDYHQRRQEEENGLTPMGWIVLVILVMIVFGQSDPARKARKTAGCGCSPLGWLVGIFGLRSYWGKRKK